MACGTAAEHPPWPHWPSPTLPLYPNRSVLVLFGTLRLASTMWNGTAKGHYEQLKLRRTGRQLSKIQFLCPRIDAKQLIVVNMLPCSGVPGGCTFASKHSCNEIVLRRLQGESDFVVIPFERNALRVNIFFKDVSSIGVPL